MLVRFSQTVHAADADKQQDERGPWYGRINSRLMKHRSLLKGMFERYRHALRSFAIRKLSAHRTCCNVSGLIVKLRICDLTSIAESG